MTDQHERFQELVAQANDIREAESVATACVLGVLIAAFTRVHPNAAEPLRGMLIAAAQDAESNIADTDLARGAFRERIGAALKMIQ
jgi:hypothetical protein